MDYLPEIIAQTAFVPCGLFMGYMFFIFEFFPPESLVDINFWPWLVGILSAALTAFTITKVKLKKKMENFYHFYAIAIGISSFLIGGCLFLYEYGTPAVYMCGIGHGVNYVSILSYVNLRISTRKRTFRIAVCHIWYFLGCGLASQVINIASTNLPTDRTEDLFFKPMGLLITATSGISLALLLLNETLNCWQIYNYKISLDKQINDANQEQSLFISKDKVINLLLRKPVHGYKLRIFPNSGRFSSVWLILLKLKGFIMFSSVMMYFAGMASVMRNESKCFDLVQWLVFGGSVIGLVAFSFYSSKNIFYLFSICQSLGLVVALMVYSDVDSLADAAFPLWLYYGFLGGGYCIADIAILDVSPLRSTEILLAIGYMLEIFPVAVLQYCLFYQTEAVILHDNLTTFRAHGFSYICCILILIAVVSIFMPNTYGKSLLEIRNELYGLIYEKQYLQPGLRSRKVPRHTLYVEHGLYTIEDDAAFGNRNLASDNGISRPSDPVGRSLRI